MKLSRQLLGFLTFFLIVGALATGIYLRLRPTPEEADPGAAGEGAATEEGVVLPEEAAQQFATDLPNPVEGAEVILDTLWITVSAFGNAASVQGAAVNSLVGGIIQEIAVSENRTVAEGDLLVRFDTTEYGLALARARAGLVSSEASYQEMTLFDDEITDPALRAERARLARARSGLVQAEVALREAEINMERTQVRAPFSGRIANLRVVAGQHVGAGTELMTVVDLDPIKVEVNVLEPNIGFVREGRGAAVTFAAFPDETFHGRVQSVNPMVDANLQTGRVTLLLNNPQGRIKPGMYADAAVEAQFFPDRILVPRNAILEKEHRTMLFVFEDGRAKWRYVTTGEANDTHVEIVPNPDTEMVAPGEIVLVNNHFYIHHDARVELVDNVSGALGGDRRMMARYTWFRPARAVPGILAIAFLFVPVGLDGQEGFVLTLEEALDRAGRVNPEYRQALNNLGLNALDRRSAMSAFLPSLSIWANTDVSMTRQLVGTDDFGYPVENPSAEWRTSSGSSQGFRLSVPIYAWGVRFQQWKVQGEQARIREADLTSRLRTLHSGVVRAYRNAQNQRALVAAEEALLARRELDLETTRRRFALAGVSRVEVLQAELAVRQQELRIQEARSGLQKALLALRTQIGDPELVGFEVMEALPEPFDPEGLDSEALVSIALSSNPALVRQEANLVIAEAQVQTAKGRRWTPINVNFGLSQRDNDLSGLNSFFDPYPDRYRGGQGYFSVGFDLQIFPFRSSFKDPVQRAEIALDNTQESLKGDRLRIDQEVRGRLIDLQVAYNAYLIALEAREISRQSLELAQGQFRLGSRSFTELQINIAADADAERAVISRLFSFLQAQTNLEETVGVELNPIGGGPPGGQESRSDLSGQEG